MKEKMNYCFLLAGAAMLAACSADEASEPVVPQDTRIVTVHAPGTRTTIDYEGSDYSHLVWNEGDRVAYATDAADDRFRTAEVSGNCFSAEVPAGVTGDLRLLVLWPAASHEGSTLATASAELAATIEQVAGAPFDGNLLPMYADVTVPEGRTEVDALYTVLGSVIRIGIDATDHEEEVLESVTLTAREPLVGRYAFDPVVRSWSFAGTSETVTVNLTGEQAVLSNHHHIYMVVNPACYTGVTLTIRTDRDSYIYADGTMDVAQRGRTLYRIDVSLNEQVEPVIPYFTQVSDAEELTADGTYLIVTEHSATQCYATGPKNMTFLDPVTLDLAPDGILQTTEAMKHTWKIEKQESGMYSLFSNELNQFVGAPGAITANDYGKFWFANEIADEEERRLIFHWEITVDAKQATIRTRRMEDCYFMYNGSSNLRWFCPCTSRTAGARPVNIYKLRE